MNVRDNILIERLAELEHEQWMSWARTILREEDVSEARARRWSNYLVPYEQLEEDVKDFDRKWAEKALHITIEEILKELVEILEELKERNAQ